MKTNTDLLEPDNIYHIYNRGVNGENIFKEERNYSYFLKKYALQIEPIAETYSYCLLKNHFHFAIKTKTEKEIVEFYKQKLPTKLEIPNCSYILSSQFGSLFNGYAQAINKSTNRKGGLFEEPFRRILVESDEYLTELIYYIHRNPQNHGFVNDFKSYRYSSYKTILSQKPTRIKREEVINWYGNINEFEKFHLQENNFKDLNKFRIEYD
jgi:hypothetical protein